MEWSSVAQLTLTVKHAAITPLMGLSEKGSNVTSYYFVAYCKDWSGPCGVKQCSSTYPDSTACCYYTTDGTLGERIKCSV